jgi:hypothetical protein
MNPISISPRFHNASLWILLTISCMLQPCSSFIGTSFPFVASSPFIGAVGIRKEIRHPSESQYRTTHQHQTASAEDNDQEQPILLQDLTSDLEEDLEEIITSPESGGGLTTNSLTPYEFQRLLLEARLKFEANTIGKEVSYELVIVREYLSKFVWIINYVFNHSM